MAVVAPLVDAVLESAPISISTYYLSAACRPLPACLLGDLVFTRYAHSDRQQQQHRRYLWSSGPPLHHLRLAIGPVSFGANPTTTHRQPPSQAQPNATQEPVLVLSCPVLSCPVLFCFSDNCPAPSTSRTLPVSALGLSLVERARVRYTTHTSASCR